MRKTTHNKRYDIPLGRAIYVDQTNGVDTNNGSASQPLKTIATVNGLKLRPNDKIMFKRGESWTEKLKSTIDGKPNNFITYGAYGSGALPKVTCPAGEDNAFGTVDALGMPHNFFRVQDMEFVGKSSDTTYATFSSHGHDFELLRLTVSNGGHDNIQCTDKTGKCYNIVISGCTCHSTQTYSGIYVGDAQAGGTQDPPHNVLIIGNTCYSNGGAVVNEGYHGIYVGGVINTLIKNNTCYSNKGGGIKHNGTCSNIVIDSNYCYSNTTGIYAFGTNGKVINNYVTLNTDGGIKLNTGGDNNIIANNSIIDNFYYGIYFIDDSTMIGNVIKNNLVVQNQTRSDNYHPLRIPGATPWAIVAKGTLNDSNLINNNVYWYNNAYLTRVVNPQTGSNMKLADWKLVSGSPDSNTLNQNPQTVTEFTNPHLQSSSPCIGIGVTDLGITNDYDGNPRGVLVDIGAFEYVA